jgi:hypothetical protein
MHGMYVSRPIAVFFVVALVAVLAGGACKGKPSPTDPEASQPHGRLSGVVTIGPNCPVTMTTPCPTQPSAYSLRKILVYDETKKTLLHTVDIDSQGFYYIDLLPAKYTIDLKGVGIDRTSDVPKVVDIHASVVTRVDINIDTGIR